MIQFFYGINILDVAAEKTQQTLIAGIEAFDPAKLKHTKTQEKNPLPDKEGTCVLRFFTEKVVIVKFSFNFCSDSARKGQTTAYIWN